MVTEKKPRGGSPPAEYDPEFVMDCSEQVIIAYWHGLPPAVLAERVKQRPDMFAMIRVNALGHNKLTRLVLQARDKIPADVPERIKEMAFQVYLGGLDGSKKHLAERLVSEPNLIDAFRKNSRIYIPVIERRLAAIERVEQNRKLLPPQVQKPKDYQDEEL